MRKKKAASKPDEPRIVTVRGQRVILDADLAQTYGVETRVLNQAVKRNVARFPSDFAFQLTTAEAEALRSQIVTLEISEAGDDAGAAALRSQIAMLKKGRGQHRKFQPWVFTEHGALMAANILRSARAVEMSVYVVRAFIRQREMLATSAEILRKLELIDHRLLAHDQALVNRVGEDQGADAPGAGAPAEAETAHRFPSVITRRPGQRDARLTGVAAFSRKEKSALRK